MYLYLVTVEDASDAAKEYIVKASTEEEAINLAFDPERNEPYPRERPRYSASAQPIELTAENPIFCI